MVFQALVAVSLLSACNSTKIENVSDANSNSNSNSNAKAKATSVVASVVADHLNPNSAISKERSVYFGFDQFDIKADQAAVVERVTFSSAYSISPTLSSDGKSLAYISKIGSQYKLHLMNLEAQTTVELTDTVADERPSFAPNGRLIVYVTQQGGRDTLMTTTLDGKVKVKLAGQVGDMREPNWGPFIFKNSIAK
jgi:TolB protein